MNATACIKTRRSVRRFQNTPVNPETVREAVELASFAPSWKNSQTTRYTLLADPAEKEKLLACMMGFEHNSQIVSGAPAVMVITTVDHRSGYERDGSFTTSKGTHWQSFDAGIATQTFCLAAHELGLSTVIMGIFDAEKVAEVLEIPEGQSVSALVAVGYADENPEAPRRKSVEDLLTIR